MEELRKLYYEFEKITDSYRGSRTDWKEKCDRLEKLAAAVSELKIRHSRNSLFHSWIRDRLREEIRGELIRVWKLAQTEPGSSGEKPDCR